MSSNLSRDAIAPSTLAVVGRACLRTCACSARNIIENTPAFDVWSRESREQQVGISQRLNVTGSRLPRDTKKMLNSQVEWIRCWELQTSGRSPDYGWQAERVRSHVPLRIMLFRPARAAFLASAGQSSSQACKEMPADKQHSSFSVRGPSRSGSHVGCYRCMVAAPLLFCRNWPRLRVPAGSSQVKTRTPCHLS